MAIFPSFGGAAYSPSSQKVIRLLLKGCTNRPFYHISVQELRKEPYEPVIEQIGNYDPLPNNHNEKLVAINYQRLEYWIREGARVTDPVRKLLGLSGYFPVHPESLRNACDRRKQILLELEKLKSEVAELQGKEATSSEKTSVESTETETVQEESVSSSEGSSSQTDDDSSEDSSQSDDNSSEKTPKN